MRQRFLYEEDVHSAVNINTLEERIKLKRWIVVQLQSKVSQEKLIRLIQESGEKDRHRLWKGYQVRV